MLGGSPFLPVSPSIRLILRLNLPLSMSDCFGFFFASGYSMMISRSFVCLKYCLLGCSFVRCSVAYCSIGFNE